MKNRNNQTEGNELYAILDKYGKVPQKPVFDRLKALNRSLFGRELKFKDGFSSKSITDPRTGEYDVEIADGWLLYGCPEGYVNLAGYVITVQHMYHEYRHVQHYTNEWNRIPAKEMTIEDDMMADIVRRNLIRDFVLSAYAWNYENDPGEIDAELYGIEHAIRYFKHDSVISSKAPGTAESILYEIIASDSYGHKQQLEPYGINDMDGLLSALENIRSTAIHVPYPVTTEKPPALDMDSLKPSPYDITETFLTSDRYMKHRKSVDECSDGKIIDKILEQAIILEHPEVVHQVPRLQDELKGCQKQLICIMQMGHSNQKMILLISQMP